LTSLEMRPPAAPRASTDAPPPAASAEAARLYTAYSEQLVGFCARRLDSKSEAEDAVQLTFLYALRALQRGVVPESESAWLYAIATNVCRWQQRTHIRRAPVAGELELDRIVEELRADGDQRGLCRDLLAALRTLPASQRRALVLREWHGLSSREVATRLGLSAPATYALLTRARHAFMRAFEARREALSSLQLGPLLYQLGLRLKALFGAASTKVAVATVIAAGAGGVAVETTLDDPRTTPSREPVVVAETVDGVPASALTPRVSSQARGTSSTTAGRPNPDTGARLVPDGGSSTGIAVPPRHPREPSSPTREPAREPEPTDPGGRDPAANPSEPRPLAPVEPPKLPEVDLPTDLLPPIDLPPVDLPSVDLPPVDVPPVEPPTELLPTVDLPPVDLPAVDVPPLDLPPLLPPKKP
jgi:RNA polymerase sigma factor (sigma-70 family)